MNLGSKVRAKEQHYIGQHKRTLLLELQTMDLTLFHFSFYFIFEFYFFFFVLDLSRRSNVMVTQVTNLMEL